MEKPVRYDVDGQEYVTNALISLLNSYPGIPAGEEILFSELSDTGGISLFPMSGAAIAQERESVTAHVRQICQYPFSVIWRSATGTEAQRVTIKEFLDTLGKWLERQPVRIDGTEEKLKEYPQLTGGREIQTISRRSPSKVNATYKDGVQDWAIDLMLQYKYEFDR